MTDHVLKGFGIPADEESDEFLTGVEEARERIDPDFKKRANDLFEE